MKIKVFLIVISLYLVGCTRKDDSVKCRLVPDTDLIDCYSTNDRDFRLYFNRNKEVKKSLLMMNNNKSYKEIVFHLKNRYFLKYLKRIDIVPDRYSHTNRLLFWYDSVGELISNDMYHEDINEYYYRIKVNNGYRYQVEYYLPNLKESVPLYYFTLSDQGKLLPDFFFYRKNNDNSYSILTDDAEMMIKKGMLDSLEIEYSEVKMKDMEFIFYKERNAFFPVFDEGQVKTIKNLDSTIRFENESNIVGTLWCFFSMNNEYTTRYNLLIFNGDLMSRVKQYSYLFDKYEKKYPTGKISELKDLKKNLLQVGFIEKNGGFEPSSNLLEKVQSVIDGKAKS